MRSAPASIFRKTVRDQLRPLLWWALGVIVLILVTMFSYPAVRDQNDLNDLWQDLPEELRALVGGAETDLVSPAGFLNSQYFALLAPILFLIYAIAMGSGAIAGEEEHGTLDLLLAQPVSRRRVLLEKFAGMAVSLTALGVVAWLALWGGALAVDMDIGAGLLAAANVSVTLLGLLFGTLALAVGSISGRRTLSLAVAAGVAFASYLLNSLAPVVDAPESVRWFSPFYYFIGGDPLRNGLNAGHVAVLLGLTAILLVAGIVVFDRRDVAV
jgi:ABC-2 type transport system permease protein